MENIQDDQRGVSFAALPGSANGGKLTAEQRRNWRNVLVGMLGPYALIMPDEDIDKFRDKCREQWGIRRRGAQQHAEGTHDEARNGHANREKH